MDCKDLMIGDWVNYSILNINSKVVSIIGNHTITIQFVDKNDKIGVIHGLLEETINPIPLTEEILVKNGFEYAYNEASEMQNKQLLVANIGGHYIEIRLDKRNVAIWYDYDENGDGVYSDVLIDLPHHVHKFQHLLRLCGIEKELVID